MKHVYMINGVGGRCLAFVTAFSLCACSVLQIDVDEYKGPMANHEDIQLQQYIALATSAKPLIVALRNNYILDDDSYESDKNSDKVADRDCLQNNRADIDEYVACAFTLDIAYFLNSILALYENNNDINNKIKFNQLNSTPSKSLFSREQKTNVSAENRARNELGITELTIQFINATNAAYQSQDKKILNKALLAKEHLNVSLIIFAEKILYTVNNHQLANGSTNKDSFAKKLAVLQSLGNTLVVHADDLRKRAAHDQRLVDRKDSELAASRLAFAPGAQNAFDNLTRDLSAAIQEKIKKEASLQSAINTFSKMNITEESISNSKMKLINDAQEKQPTLDTYRTIFNDYNFKIEGNILADSLVADDRSAIASLIEKTSSPVTTKAVLDKLDLWLKDKIKTPPTSPTPEHDRRVNAKTYLEKLSGENLGITDGTEKEVFKKLGGNILAGLNVDNVNLEERQRNIADHLQALNTNKKNTEELPTLRSTKNKLETARETIGSLKQVVLQQAETANVVDLSGLRLLLLLELKEKGKSENDPAKKDNFLAAGDVLTAMPIPMTFRFSGGSTVKTQRDVLDDVITQLQQQRLEAASRGGDITTLNKALELAYEQRGEFAYLRPASAYLRNAFANTSIQDNSSSTNCRNLLFSLFCNESGDLAFHGTKLEIDKQFWQTINTVKVRGGGTTDFAIVKDDVGNWYVKGLSSDPESIIKSAQSLALFNMGGKVNLNLLGQVETRRKLAKLDIGDSNRTILKKELEEQQSGSGANTAGLAKVLAKYRKEYVDATTMNVDGLIGKLDQLPTDIRAAWQGINFDEITNFEKLKALLGTTPAELVTAKQLLEAAKVVLAQADARAAGTAKAAASEAANTSASDAIVKSLVEVRNMRSRLVKAIIQNDELIATQRQAYEDAKVALYAQDVVVTDKKNTWEKANVNVTNMQALLDAMTAPEKVAEKRAALTTAENGLKEAQDALDGANKEREDGMNAEYKALENATKQRDIEQKKYDADTATDKSKTALEQATIALDNAKESLDSTIKEKNANVSTKTAARDAADSKKKIQQGIFEGLTASSEIESAKNNLKAAKEKLATAKTEWEGADGVLAGSRTAAKEAENAYTFAKSNRLAAARKVTILADSLIETTAANRLEAVKAYEVAIGFVGQTAGGQ